MRTLLNQRGDISRGGWIGVIAVLVSIIGGGLEIYDRFFPPSQNIAQTYKTTPSIQTLKTSRTTPAQPVKSSLQQKSFPKTSPKLHQPPIQQPEPSQKSTSPLKVVAIPTPDKKQAAPEAHQQNPSATFSPPLLAETPRKASRIDSQAASSKTADSPAPMPHVVAKATTPTANVPPDPRTDPCAIADPLIHCLWRN